MTVNIEEWREHLESKELAPNTINSYLCALRQYASEYGEVSKANVIKYKRDLIASGKAPKTVNCRILAMNQYANWAGITCDVKPMRTQRSQTLDKVISIEEKDRILRGLYADGDMQGWAMVATLASTGVRVGELIQLQKTLLRDGGQTITNKGKTRKVYAPQSLIESVSSYYQSVGGPLLFFPRGADGYRPITCRAVSYRLKQYARQYDVPTDVCHAHSFRHLFGKEFMRRNGNITLLADLMGHSSIATTQIYTRMSEQEQLAELNEVVTW